MLSLLTFKNEGLVPQNTESSYDPAMSLLSIHPK